MYVNICWNLNTLLHIHAYIYPSMGSYICFCIWHKLNFCFGSRPGHINCYHIIIVLLPKLNTELETKEIPKSFVTSVSELVRTIHVRSKHSALEQSQGKTQQSQTSQFQSSSSPSHTHTHTLIESTYLCTMGNEWHASQSCLLLWSALPGRMRKLRKKDQITV